jgi:uncharacterized membrane protein YgdD (TMEM256/DUF423 family)
MARVLLIVGSLNAFLAVALGAFGAHALRGTISDAMLEVYKTGVQYQMAHALGLILIALLSERMADVRLARLSGVLLTVGIVLFSGSLYALALTGTRIFGAITPLGGLCFLAGWALLVVAALRVPGTLRE